MNLADLTAMEARRLIGARAISPVELIDACIARIEAVDPAVNAMVVRAFERARNEAMLAEAAVRRGDALPSLHGLPVAIKDIHDTAGVTTTYGSEAFAHNVPAQDAPIVARIRAAGGIVIGKTNVPEHSIGANTVNRLFGATGNPFDAERTCGGSSGGSAVAVATGMAPLATGSDHGGSLRIPACFSGVVGYRATPGVVPNERRTVAHTTYSVPGPMARTVDDVALLLSVIARRDAMARRDPMAFPLDADAFARLAPIDLSRLRVAFSPDLGGVLVSRAVRELFASRVSDIARCVAACEPASLDLSSAPDVDWRLRQELFLAQYAHEAEQWDEGFNPNVRATYDAARATPLAAVAAARREQMALYQHTAALFDAFDVLVCPGVSIPPFPWHELNPRFIDGTPVTNYMAWLALTASITVVGLPAVALPCGADTNGLPFGVQLVGPAFGDARLLAIARAFEAEFARTRHTRAPVPDCDALANMRTSCRSLGRTVQLGSSDSLANGSNAS